MRKAYATVRSAICGSQLGGRAGGMGGQAGGSGGSGGNGGRCGGRGGIGGIGGMHSVQPEHAANEHFLTQEAV